MVKIYALVLWDSSKENSVIPYKDLRNDDKEAFWQGELEPIKLIIKSRKYSIIKNLFFHKITKKFFKFFSCF